MRSHLLLFVLVVATPFGTDVRWELGLDPNSQIVIRGFGSDGRDDFCSGFQLTETQVRAFFGGAQIITPRELHDEYDWLSCYVKGIVRDAHGGFEWEIRAGGTARLNWCDGRTVLLGCKDCEDGFR